MEVRDVSCCDCERNKTERPRWGPGPWQSEPDYESFTFAGLECHVHRSPFSWWRGYVGVSAENKMFNVHYEDAAGVLKLDGRLSWSHNSVEHREPCGLWWFGFELNLFGQAPADYGPMLQRGHLASWRYYSLPDAKRETARLAEQLARLGFAKKNAGKAPALVA